MDEWSGRRGNFRAKGDIIINNTPTKRVSFCDKMRYRLGRTIRFFIALALLVFLVPFLMTKLDSSTRHSLATEPRMDRHDVRINLVVLHWYSSMNLFRIKEIIEKLYLLDINRTIIIYNLL